MSAVARRRDIDELRREIERLERERERMEQLAGKVHDAWGTAGNKAMLPLEYRVHVDTLEAESERIAGSLKERRKEYEETLKEAAKHESYPWKHFLPGGGRS